jgi:hypothetical protein
MSQSSSIALNIKQNRPNFVLELIEDQAPLFKYKFVSKVLDPPNDNPELFRTVTVRCLFIGCK